VIGLLKTWVSRLRGTRAAGIGPPESNLKGAPPHARTKTYSAETGYVYQYVYRGYRPSPTAAGDEFVFFVRHGDKSFHIYILIANSALGDCAVGIGRDVLPRERYALAKMALFSTFDGLTDPHHLEYPVVPSGAEMESYLRTLGRA
jgi:hypothetical protein